MKKTIIFGAIALLGASSLTSCKKTWSCECTTSLLGTTTSSTISIPDQRKSDAKTICENADSPYDNSSDISMSCELK